MLKLHSIISILITLVSLSAFNFANANDDETPAVEEICDVLIGGTPGLYGLCVAYCEAQDGEVDLTSEEAIMDLSTPSRKILANYDRKIREGDPKMPCVNYQTTCPGWSQTELEDLGTHGLTALDYENETTQRFFDLEEDRRADDTVRAMIFTSAEKFYTSYFHRTSSDVSNNTSGVRNLEVTQEEFEACKQELKDHVTAP